MNDVGTRTPVSFDIMWQPEIGGGHNNSNAVNGGQIYLRKGPKAEKFLQNMDAKKDIILKGRHTQFTQYMSC